MNEIKIIKKKYKNSDDSYLGMFMDLGYAVIPISYDAKQISEYLGMAVKDLYDIAIHSNINDILFVASVQFKPYNELQGLVDKSLEKGVKN